MRTMLVADLITTLANATDKRDLVIISSDGSNVTAANPVFQSNENRDVPAVLINTLGNGSFKKFEIYPYNFRFTTQLSGDAANVIPIYSITYPTGNARVDSFSNQFTGGIVIKHWNDNQKAYETDKIVPIEVIGSSNTVAVADVKVAFKATMATLIGTGKGKYFASVVHTAETSSVYTLNDTDYFVELVGDLRWWNFVKTNGSNLAVTGEDAVKLERELAPNSGYNRPTDLDNDLYAASNFIADASVPAYDIISIFTSQDRQRELVLGSGGFETECHIYVPHTAYATTFTILINFLTLLSSTDSKS